MSHEFNLAIAIGYAKTDHVRLSSFMQVFFYWPVIHKSQPVSKEVLELKALIKDSEKKEGKSRNDLELLCVRAKSSFQFCFVLFCFVLFGTVERLRLCK